MTDERKQRIIICLIIAAAAFICGFVLGFYIWGLNAGQPPDYKKYLQETMDYMSSLEEKNTTLTKKADKLKDEVTELKDATKENKILKEKIEQLHEEVTKIKEQAITPQTPENPKDTPPTSDK
jgi:septal ring factor EnvC (AmiA/AmiB activator)